jgi:hypothetical protein
LQIFTEEKAMMNKLKFIFLLILCAASIGGLTNISAQTSDRVLVAGNSTLRQSEVDKLIEFYEWAFETSFTKKERVRYQAFVVEGFRQDPAEARKSADVLIKVLAQVRAKDAAAQARMRQMFNEDFSKDLRAANDEESRLMLGIYERGQGADKNDETVEVVTGEQDTEENSKSLTGAGSQKLVGTWMRSDGAGGSRDYTGKTNYNSGTDTTFEFSADGTMRFSIKSETLSITQCRITENTMMSGRYTVSGNQLTMSLGAATVTGTNSCDAKGNFRKNLSASSLTKTFVVKELDSVFRPDRPLILCLAGAADDACFERDPKK